MSDLLYEVVLVLFKDMFMGIHTFRLHQVFIIATILTMYETSYTPHIHPSIYLFIHSYITHSTRFLHTYCYLQLFKTSVLQPPH